MVVGHTHNYIIIVNMIGIFFTVTAYIYATPATTLKL